MFKAHLSELEKNNFLKRIFPRTTQKVRKIYDVMRLTLKHEKQNLWALLKIAQNSFRHCARARDKNNTRDSVKKIS